MKHVRVGSAAAREVAEAAAWYQERAELRADFLREFRAAVRQIELAPASVPPAPGVAPELGVYRCLMARFPYALFFKEKKSDLRVLAVAHHGRRPGYWRSRL